jgi:endo-1,3-1,4-beta-glycanase ExoK
MNSRTALFALVAAAVCVPKGALALASAELYSTKSYYYGRFEARLRFAPGDGVVSSFFLWKEGSDAANAYWNELDMEKYGASCSIQTNAFYGNPETQHQQKPSVSGDLCGGYHDYRFEWAPTYISYSIDGKENRRDTGDTATAFSQNASVGMSFHFNIWPGNSSFGGDISKTTLPVHQYISWVQYSSYKDGNFNVEWREEFQSSGVPSGWAVGDWSSPFSLSTHNPQNVSFVDGIAVLSISADNATGNPGTPPADPNATGSGGSSGTGGTSGSGGSGGNTSGLGGATGTGGANTGGTKGSGGATGTGGTNTGGSKGSGGATGTGGTNTGGSKGSGGTTATGGMPASGGTTGTAGATSTGGSKGTGGMTAAGGASGADGGASGSGDSGGTTASGVGGSAGSGGATASGGTSTTGTEDTGGTSGTTSTEAGCSCSTARSPSGFVPALLILFLVALRLRRKEI